MALPRQQSDRNMQWNKLQFLHGTATCFLYIGQNEFILGDEKPFDKGGIKGTKAKLRTVNGTPIGVCISDPRHPQNAELKTLNVSYSSLWK